MTLKLIMDEKNKWAVWNHKGQQLTKNHDKKENAVEELVKLKHATPEHAKTLQQIGSVEFG